MTLYKKLEWKKDKFTVLASDRNQEIVKYERRIDYENNGQNNLNEEKRESDQNLYLMGAVSCYSSCQANFRR